MIRLWNTWRARKAAVSAIRPFVERTRFANGEISEDRWLDAYMIGFVTMLITRIATDRVHAIDTEALGIVQANAWQDITGLPGELMGEEACLLSAGNHSDFCRGCQNAESLVAAMSAVRLRRWEGTEKSGSENDHPNLRPDVDDQDIQSLWSDYFEKHIFRTT